MSLLTSCHKMASLNKFRNISKSVNLLCKSMNGMTINNNLSKYNVSVTSGIISANKYREITTCSNLNGLMEFFDDKKNWGESEVRSGRSWKLDELRIKSNTDLHKLWYVLLKEKNMLLTMEYECNEKAQVFPSPERIDKVEESMKNLETVVRERNKAYHLLETGETGERPAEIVTNQIGIRFRYRHTEHLIPKEINLGWKKTHNFTARGHAVNKFLKLFNEKIFNEKRKLRNRNKNHVIGLLRRFPNMDMEALKSQYPDVDIEKCKNSAKARGHYVPK